MPIATNTRAKHISGGQSIFQAKPAHQVIRKEKNAWCHVSLRDKIINTRTITPACFPRQRIATRASSPSSTYCHVRHIRSHSSRSVFSYTIKTHFEVYLIQLDLSLKNKITTETTKKTGIFTRQYLFSRVGSCHRVARPDTVTSENLL